MKLSIRGYEHDKFPFFQTFYFLTTSLNRKQKMVG